MELKQRFFLAVDDYRLPDFAHLSDADWMPAFTAAMEVELTTLNQIGADTTPPTLDMIRRWELAHSYLDTVASAFWTAKDADTNDARDQIDAQITPVLAQHADAIWMNRPLYDRLVALQARVDANELEADEQDRWWISEHLRSFRRSGIDLSEADQAQLRHINQSIATLETTYNIAVLKGRAAAAVHLSDASQLAGLSPEQIAEARRAAAARGQDGWTIELVNTTGQPVLASLDDREVRRQVFTASVTRGQAGDWDTRATILELLHLRHAKARLLGFDTFAAYVADDGCAKTTEAVMDVLTRAATAAVANARREAARLQTQLDELIPGATLEAWDWAWLAEKTRKANYDLDESTLAPYLSFEAVLEHGVFAAATQLYGLSFHRRDDVAGYTDQCRTYEVRDADGSPLGLLVMDPYVRSTKQGGAWMTSLTEQGHLSEDRPVVTNNCNQTPPQPGEPSLMTWDEVTTLFHEFGHDLHGLLADSRYPSLSGTNTPRDFVEFPSQVNEMWAWDPQIIRGFAHHVTTGEPMPQHLIDTIITARNANEGFDSLEIFAAMLLDQAWHQAGEDLPTSVDDMNQFETTALARYGVDFPLIPPRYRTCYFSHIWGPGYAASYYGYLWAQVMDADTVAWFEQNGGLTRANGEKFRREVLALGGSVDVMEAYRHFRGADPDPIHIFRRRGLI